VNLTAGLPVSFWNEDTDTPGTPLAYGLAGWTKDGSAVLLYDRFDIWRVSPDGSDARNITAGYGRKRNLRLRYVRLETDPRLRWIDAARPDAAVRREPENLGERLLPRRPGWRRTETTRHGAQVLHAAGEGQGMPTCSC